MRRVVLLALFVAVVLPCAAQELDVFELSDFVDPRLRGVETEDLKVKTFGADYRFLRAVTGYIANYTTRTDPTGQDVAFVHLAANVYSGVNQYNLKVTALEPSNSQSASSRPLFRVTGQMARYSFSHLQNATTKENDEIADRYLVTVSVEERDACRTVGPSSTNENFPQPTSIVCDRHVDSEIGLQADSSIRPGGDTDFVGFTLGVRNTAEKGLVYRGTIGMRFIEHEISQMRLSIAMDHSLERGNGSLHVGATRLGIGYSIPLGKRLSLNAVYQPSYVPSEPGRSFNHEMAVFIDTTVLAQLLPRRGVTVR